MEVSMRWRAGFLALVAALSGSIAIADGEICRESADAFNLTGTFPEDIILPRAATEDELTQWEKSKPCHEFPMELIGVYDLPDEDGKTVSYWNTAMQTGMRVNIQQIFKSLPSCTVASGGDLVFSSYGEALFLVERGNSHQPEAQLVQRNDSYYFLVGCEECVIREGLQELYSLNQGKATKMCTFRRDGQIIIETQGDAEPCSALRESRYEVLESSNGPWHENLGRTEQYRILMNDNSTVDLLTVHYGCCAADIAYIDNVTLELDGESPDSDTVVGKAITQTFPDPIIPLPDLVISYSKIGALRVSTFSMTLHLFQPDGSVSFCSASILPQYRVD